MKNWNVRKVVVAREDMPEHHRLVRSLSWPHLVALGVGAIVGTGILTLIGVGAAKAGPSVILSFAIAGLICACAALAYAEMATMIPASGSAYTYTYAVMGELLAWMVGWALVLEYALGASAVAVGWSNHLVGALADSGVQFPALISNADGLMAKVALAFGSTATPDLLAAAQNGGFINVPAIVVVLAVTALLIKGTTESAMVNAVLVVVKLIALTAFMVLTLPAIKASNFHPFTPTGFGNLTSGTGYVGAAASIFFAYVGFDAVSTAAEETKNPQRNVPIGGKDGKTGQTFMKTVIAPALRARALHVDGWFSTNILGNRDGLALEDPGSLKSKLNTKGSVLDDILGYPVEDHIVDIRYYKPRGDNKEAWDNIDLVGFLGQKMQIKVNFLCRDSILAAPLVIEIARVLDLARQRGEGGIQEQLGLFFKAPMTPAGKREEHSFPVQERVLLDWLAA